MVKREKTGTVFDIQRFSIQDGPGIRTTIFLKGCSLHCPWCSNPESQSKKQELAHFNSNCVLCGKCLESCPDNLISIKDNHIIIDRKFCNVCGKCKDTCIHGAMEIIGRVMSVTEVMNEILSDVGFYKASKGGVTLSGGDPIFQSEFSREILMQCKRERIHTAIETSGHGSWHQVLRTAEFADLVFYDLKIMNSEQFKIQLGGDIEIVKSNLKSLDELGKELIVRVPLVPGFTDSFENIKQIVQETIKLKNIIRIEFLLFHQLGKHKYHSLDKIYTLESVKPVVLEQMEHVFNFLNEKSIRFKVIS